jgi:hypothetical protein
MRAGEIRSWIFGCYGKQASYFLVLAGNGSDFKRWPKDSLFSLIFGEWGRVLAAGGRGTPAEELSTRLSS